VARLRGTPLNPHATERSFASKRSISVVDAVAYLAARPEERERLASLMAADIAPFGQMACSSPQVVYWVGRPGETLEALSDFGPRMEPAMAAKLGEADLGWAVRRLDFGFDAAARGVAMRLDHQSHTTQVVASSAKLAEPADPCGVGLLTHASLGSVDELVPLIGRNHQTVTYFGLSPADRERVAEDGGRAGIDRVVPVGSALEFGPYWDGFNLWDDLTRFVVVR
jgi:acyl-CoA reductase LuxC